MFSPIRVTHVLAKSLRQQNKGANGSGSCSSHKCIHVVFQLNCSKNMPTRFARSIQMIQEYSVQWKCIVVNKTSGQNDKYNAKQKWWWIVKSCDSSRICLTRRFISFLFLEMLIERLKMLTLNFLYIALKLDFLTSASDFLLWHYPHVGRDHQECFGVP